MSQENVEILRRCFEAVAERDLDGLLANFTDDVEWRLIGGFADLIGSEFRGREALRAFFTDWLETLGGEGELETILDVGDRVVAVISTVGAGGTSGASASMRWGQVCTFREGLISAVDNYYYAADALKAVGLSE